MLTQAGILGGARLRFIACRCALCLLKEDAGELLRRLSIICLEDAILHPGLPFVVWLMAAHSKVRRLFCRTVLVLNQSCPRHVMACQESFRHEPTWLSLSSMPLVIRTGTA